MEKRQNKRNKRGNTYSLKKKKTERKKGEKTRDKCREKRVQSG
jgi:hypothetical protein